MTPENKLIALTGPMGVGKTTYAKKLAEEMDGVIYSFASTLKEMLVTLVGRGPIYEDKESPIVWLPEWNGRRLMQKLGDEWGRTEIDNDLWVRVMEYRFHSSYAPVRIIDDLRYPNEAHMVRRLGGEIWLCEREGIEYSNSHSSEKGLPTDLIDRLVTL